MSVREKTVSCVCLQEKCSFNVCLCVNRHFTECFFSLMPVMYNGQCVCVCVCVYVCVCHLLAHTVSITLTASSFQIKTPVLCDSFGSATF